MQATREQKVEEILRCLNDERIRATYGAVGAVIGVPAQSVGGYLGERRPEASWVVNSDTEQPTCYTSGEKHPDLCRTTHIIRTCGDLDALLRKYREGLAGEPAAPGAAGGDA